MEILFSLVGLFFGSGLSVLVGSFNERTHSKNTSGTILHKVSAKKIIVLLASLLAGGLVFLVSHWIVFGIGMSTMIYLLAFSKKFMKNNQKIEKLAAIVSWTEMIRDTLSASAGITQAIIVSSANAPDLIKPELILFASSLREEIPPRIAIEQLANTFNEEIADLICLALLTALEGRVKKVSELLSSLCDSARAEINARLEIESSRSSVITSAKLVVITSISFALGLALLAKNYMAPYNSFNGQLVLILVLLIYGAGITLLLRMLQSQPCERLLGTEIK